VSDREVPVLPRADATGMSSGPRRRLGNIVALLGANVVGRLLTLLYVTLVARLLAPEGFGLLVTVTAYLTIFGAVTDFGVTTIAVRDVARDPGLAAAYLRRALLLRGGLAAAAYLELALCGAVAGYPPDQQRLLWVGGLSLFPLAVTGAFTAILTAHERIAPVAGLSTLGAAVMLASAWPVLVAGWGVTGLLAVLVGVNLLQAALAAGWALRIVRPAAAGEGAWQAAGRLLGRAWPYGCFTVLAMVHLRMATLVLSTAEGPEAVGLYNAAFKLVEALTALPVALMGGLFPLMAAQSREGATGPLGETYRRGVRVLALLALPVAVGLTLLAAPVVELVYGAGYDRAAPVLRILVWGLALLYLNAPVGQVIFTSDQGRRFLPWALLNTGGYAVLTALLVARHGIAGAAVAYVVAEATGFAIQLRFVRSTVGRLPSLPAILWRPAVAAAVMGGVVALGLALDVGPLLLVPVGAVVYGAMLGLLGEVRGEDRALLRAWLIEARPQPGGPLNV
jgi:O-antigen/teichoic acid export membrane protein